MRRSLLFLSFTTTLFAQQVQVAFNPEDPYIGPFPNNFLTVTDPAQKSGRRVNLSTGGCQSPTGDCAELNLLNQLDGFHLQARLTVRFSGAVNPDTLRDGVFLVWMETAYPRAYELGSVGKITPINQVQWDPQTNTAYAKPDQPLEQGRLYGLLVTEGVRDWQGQSVVSDPGFDACVRGEIGGAYCVDVGRAVRTASIGRVLGGSVFTTLSATAWLESAAAATRSTSAAFQPVTSFAISDIQSITWRQQTQTAADSSLAEVPFPAPPSLLAQAGIARMAFATIKSPRFLNAQGTIAQQPTGATPQVPAQSDEIAFHVFLPSTPMPPGGYPVVLAGHGLGDSRFGMPTVVAASFAKSGFAVVAMSAYGHGFGPRSTLRVVTATGTTDVPAPGRGVDVDGDGRIDAFEGCVLLSPGTPIGIRDCIRQTALDYTAVVRAIRAGMDLDGDGRLDLNPFALSYVGQSLGSFYGSLVTAIEPSIPVSVLNVGGGSAIESIRYSPSLRLLAVLYFINRKPPLLNAPFNFDEQYPERYQPVEILTVDGAAAVGEVMDRLEWIEAQGAPFSFAPLFKSATPPGQFIKRVLLQAAWGDMTVPNPSNSLLIRAANLRENSSFYRHDYARLVAPDLPANPHPFLAWLIGTQAQQAIATAANAQALMFIQSGTEQVPDVNFIVRPIFGRDLFETPAFLPEGPNFGQ